MLIAYMPNSGRRQHYMHVDISISTSSLHLAAVRTSGFNKGGNTSCMMCLNKQLLPEIESAVG